MTTATEVCPTCGRPNVGLDEAHALKLRLVRAREVFQNARQHIRDECAAGEIGSHERTRYLNLVDLIEPAIGAPDVFDEDHVKVVEEAVVALRDKAIEIRHEGDICAGGLARFLKACGLRPYDRNRYEQSDNSPWASDYPEEVE